MNIFFQIYLSNLIYIQDKHLKNALVVFLLLKL